MTSKLDSLKNGKHISFLLLASITFTYLSSFRLYINENIYKAFDLSNIGPIGRKLNVSIIIALVIILGWILGTITARFTSKKIKNNTTLYWMSSLFAIVALMFTPYNLQILMTSSIMQTIAMVLCIVHILFALVDMWLFSWSLCIGCNNLCSSSNKTDSIYVIIATVVSAVLAYLSVWFKFSFPVCISVYASILLLINIIHNMTYKETELNEHNECLASKKVWNVWGVVTVWAAVVLIGGYFITESLIALG